MTTDSRYVQHVMEPRAGDKTAGRDRLEVFKTASEDECLALYRAERRIAIRHAMERIFNARFNS